MTTINILPFPDAAIPIETKMDLSFTQDDLDPEIVEAQKNTLRAQMAAKNEAYCSKQAWWSCNTGQTQGACHLSPESTCVPVGAQSEPQSYFDLWLLVHRPVYNAMVEKTPSKRSLSVEPRPAAAATAASQVTLPSAGRVKFTLPPPPNSNSHPMFARHFGPKKP